MKKIILIEDDVFLHELYERVLKRAQYTIVGSYDGEDALVKVHANTDADLVLLDIMLPKKHGIDVLRDLKGNDKTKNMPVVLLSNLGEESIIKEAFKLGIRDYIKKISVTPLELVQYVGKYLNDPTFKLEHEMQ